MEMSSLSKKNLRYLSYSYLYFSSPFLQSPFNPSILTSLPLQNPISNSPQLPTASFPSTRRSFPQSQHFSRYSGLSILFYIGLVTHRSHSTSRCFSVSSVNLTQYATQEHVSDIIELITSGDDDLESKLKFMNVNLYVGSVIEILRALNIGKVSALRFFYWVREWQPEFYFNSDICSLIIDNCGLLGDYEAMHCLLNGFSRSRISLNQKAFGFLPIMISSESLTKNSILRVVNLLNEVGGSACVSGIHALIGVLSSFGSFEMARFVLKETERKVSYFNVLIREMCRRCDFDGARDMLGEMRQLGCDPNETTYNYILSNLCKKEKISEAVDLLLEILEGGCPPNALSFEIFICYFCKLGKVCVSSEFFDLMVASGLEPRLTTHAAFIKGYFNLCRYDEAYKYVVGSSDKYKHTSNANYSLLARLHQKKGNLLIALNILSEMINNGLKPCFPVYMKVLKHLCLSGREDLAKDLKSRFSNLSLPSSTDTGKFPSEIK